MTGRLACVASVCGLMFAASVAQAAPGALVGWGGTGEVGTRTEMSEGRSTARPLVQESSTRGWLSGSLAGQLPRAKLLTWSWTARPSFVRSNGNMPGAAVETDALAHQFVALSQPSHWLSGQFSADRDHVVADRGADASRESRTRRAESRFELRPGFATLGVTDRHEQTDDRWVSTALAPELERQLRRRTNEAWLESSHMRLMRRDVRERVPGVAHEIRTSHTTFDHGLSWGRGSRLSSRLEWASQSPDGATLVDRLIQERVHIRHQAWLASDYRLEDTHARLLSGEGTSRSHFLELAGRADGVGFAFGGGVRRDRSPGRAGASWSIGPRTSWQRAWAGGARMSAQAGGSLEHERRTGARDAVLPVSNEAHTVPASRAFSLLTENVDFATVVVRDANGSGGFAEGADYVLQRSGFLLDIFIPFGSRITPGDRLLISYEATPAGTPGRRSVRTDAAWGLDWRGLSLALEDRRTRATDKPVDRGALQLGARENVAHTGASVTYGPVRTDLGANARWREVSGIRARNLDANLGLAWRMTSSALIFADASLTQGRESGLRLGSSLQRVRAEWNAGGRWRCSLRVERARFERASAGSVVQRSLGADASARLGLLELSGRAETGARDGTPGHQYRRASLSAVRRFR